MDALIEEIKKLKEYEGGNGAGQVSRDDVLRLIRQHSARVDEAALQMVYEKHIAQHSRGASITALRYAITDYLRSSTPQDGPDLQRMRTALEEIREIWAGAEIDAPVHAQSSYTLRMCKKMYQEAANALAALQQQNKGEG